MKPAGTDATHIAPTVAAKPGAAQGGEGFASGGLGRGAGHAAKMPAESRVPEPRQPGTTTLSESGGVAMTFRKAGVAPEPGKADPAEEAGQAANAAPPRSDSLMNGTDINAGNVARTAGGVGGGMVGDNSPPAMVVSLNISSAAVQQKTFEGLLSRMGMVDMQSAAAAARRGRNGGYVQQNSIGQMPLGVVQGQRNLTSPSVPGNNASYYEAPAIAGQRQIVAKGADSYSFKGSTPQLDNSVINGNFAPAGGPPPIVYDIDATGGQVFEVLQQIAQKPESFSAPVIQSATVSNADKVEELPKQAERGQQQVAEDDSGFCAICCKTSKTWPPVASMS